MFAILLAPACVALCLSGIAAALWLSSTMVAFGVVIGAATGVQLICDSYLRARTSLLTLGGLHATLNGTFCACVLGLALAGSLTAPLFLTGVALLKLGFVGLTLLIARPRLTARLRGDAQALSEGVRGGGATILAVSLGLFDVLALSLVGADAAPYIAARHFGYGLFLVVVQDGAVPLLIARLVRNVDVAIDRLAAIGLGVALAVGLAAGTIGAALTYWRTGAPPDMEICVLIMVSLGAHAGAVFVFNAAYVSGRLGGGAVLTGLGCVVICFAGVWLAAPGLATVALTGAAANAMVAAIALDRFGAARRATPSETST